MNTNITDPVLLNLERDKRKLQIEIENLNKTKNDAFREQSVAITKLRTMREELTTEVDALAERRSLLQQEIADSGEAVTSYKESALQRLDRELEGKRKRINDLHSRLEKEEKELQQEKLAYKEKQEQLEQSRLIIHERTRNVEIREKNVKEHDEQLSKLVATAQSATKTAEHRKAQLDKEIAELEATKNELESDMKAINAKHKKEHEELLERAQKIKLQEILISDTVEVQKQKKQELDNREIWINDRYQALQDATKEMQKKGVKI